MGWERVGAVAARLAAAQGKAGDAAVASERRLDAPVAVWPGAPGARTAGRVVFGGAWARRIVLRPEAARWAGGGSA